MSAPTSNPSAEDEHHLEWNDRLQDWLDSDLDAAETAALQAHLADCALCRGRAEELQELDRSLVSAAPHLALDAAFDAKIFARIDAMGRFEGAEGGVACSRNNGAAEARSDGHSVGTAYWRSVASSHRAQATAAAA